MSQENVEIAKRGIEAFNQRRVETIDELATPDFEWLPAIPVTVGGGVYRGRRGVEAYFEEVRSTWQELRIDVDEFCDVGDRVLALGRIKGRGRNSGIEVDTPLAIVFELRGGRPWRSRGFFDPAEALKAVGLKG